MTSKNILSARARWGGTDITAGRKCKTFGTRRQILQIQNRPQSEDRLYLVDQKDGTALLEPWQSDGWKENCCVFTVCRQSILRASV